MSNIIKSSRIMEKEKLDIDRTSHIQDGLILEAKKEYAEIINKANIEASEIIEIAKKQTEIMLEDGESKKEEVMHSTYKRAKDVLEENKQKGLQEGYNEGYKLGFDKGYDEGKEASNALIEEALSLKEKYIEHRKSLLIDLEEDIIRLVVEIYEKIIHEKSEQDSEVIISLVLNGIENLDLTDKLTVITSKEDYDILEISKDIILAKASMISQLDIKYDSTFEKGDCVLETPKGNIDASLKNQLVEVKEILYSILKNE